MYSSTKSIKRQDTKNNKKRNARRGRNSHTSIGNLIPFVSCGKIHTNNFLQTGKVIFRIYTCVCMSVFVCVCVCVATINEK